MNLYDSRNDLEKCVDQYVLGLQIACGEKNPIRRKAFETDVHYALQSIEPFKARYQRVMGYDIFAADPQCDQAIEHINHALALIHAIGGESSVPILENPRLILAECAMTFIDTLQSLDALDADGAVVFVEAVLQTLDAVTLGSLYDVSLKTLVYRYLYGQIPEAVLDRFAEEERALLEYLTDLEEGV